MKTAGLRMEKRNMSFVGHLLPGKENEIREWWPMVAVSMLGHVVVFACLILTPLSSPEPFLPPAHIPIDLGPAPAPAPVSKTPEDAPKTPEKVESKAETPEPTQPETDRPEPVESTSEPPRTMEPTVDEPEPAPEPPKLESLEIPKTSDMPPLLDEEAPALKQPLIVKKVEKKRENAAPAPRKKFSPKRSLKKKTFKTASVKKQALAKIRKDVEQSGSKAVESAIDRMRREVENTRPDNGDEAARAGQEGGVPGGRGVSLEKMAIYRAEIQYRVRRNWAFSKQLTGGRTNLEVVISFKILRSGDIRDVRFEKKSGNAYLDDSAMRAVQKSAPFSELPKEYIGPFYDVGLRFSEKGLK